MAGGMGATFTPGTTTYSAAVPGRCSPTTRKPAQSDVSPFWHAAQRPQETPGLIITRSPGRTSVTSAPTASTTPAPSDPTMCGNAYCTPGSPSATKRSSRLSAAACTRIRTSVGSASSGCGSSRTARCSRPPTPSSASALMPRGSSERWAQHLLTRPERHEQRRRHHAQRLDPERQLRLALAGLGQLAGYVRHALSVTRHVQGDHRLVDLEHRHRILGTWRDPHEARLAALLEHVEDVAVGQVPRAVLPVARLREPSGLAPVNGALVELGVAIAGRDK